MLSAPEGRSATPMPSIDRPAESGRRVSLSRSQIGRYLCFEVGDNAGNYGYRSYRIAHWPLSRPPARHRSPPPIAITQTETRLTASTEADDADSGSWRNLRIHDGHCDRESFGGDFEESPVVDLAPAGGRRLRLVFRRPGTPAATGATRPSSSR